MGSMRRFLAARRSVVNADPGCLDRPRAAGFAAAHLWSAALHAMTPDKIPPVAISNEEVAKGRIPLGRVLRDQRPKSTQPAVSNGYPNIYAATTYPGGKLIPFDSGINVIA